MSLGVRDFLDRRQKSSFIQPFLECRLAGPERLPLGGCKPLSERLLRKGALSPPLGRALFFRAPGFSGGLILSGASRRSLRKWGLAKAGDYASRRALAFIRSENLSRYRYRRKEHCFRKLRAKRADFNGPLVKPARMHHRTFDAIVERIKETETAYCLAWLRSRGVSALLRQRGS